jgi:UDP-N-acetyl-2-amino-2-deoxyglucuronate dehydrogenase
LDIAGLLLHTSLLLIKVQTLRLQPFYSSRPHDDAAESEKWGSPIKTYTDLNAMLSDKSIDAVSITSYSDQHAAQAIAAARAGKHIILEKPMALSWEDCLMIDAEVKKAGVKSLRMFRVPLF